MLDLLPASRRDLSPRPVVGAVWSTLVHVAIVAAYVVGIERAAAARLAELAAAERQTPEFILPPNRGRPMPSEHVSYLAVGEGDAPYGLARGSRKSDKRSLLELAQVSGARDPVQLLSIAVPESTVPDNAYSVLDVDSAAARDPSSAAPAYPPMMMAKGIEGSATMRFVIDSTGLIDLATVSLLEATHAEFVQAVREAMPRMRFRPAKMGLLAVRQLAEQMFRFEIRRVATSDVAPSKKP